MRFVIVVASGGMIVIREEPVADRPADAFGEAMDKSGGDGMFL